MFKRLKKLFRDWREIAYTQLMDPYTPRWQQGAIMRHLLATWWMIAWAARRAWCAVAGHKLVDLDHGDCEVGPQPDVQCTRCGRQF